MNYGGYAGFDFLEVLTYLTFTLIWLLIVGGEDFIW